MRIFFSAGEPSGDLHASNLIREMRELSSDLVCVGFGGPKMQAVGCELLCDLTQHAVMMFTQAIRKARQFSKFLGDADRYFATQSVDAVVLIDFPGFNWWIARKAKARGIPVFYYGIPQMWAWAPWRIRKLRALVDLAICKLPFEPEWLARRGVRAEFVGHPFFDELAQRRVTRPELAQNAAVDKPHLLLLPGSRDQEVRDHWPLLRNAAEKCLSQFPDLRVSVGCFRERHWQSISADLADSGLPIRPYCQQTPELMASADVCLACSGSVSLELMYHQLPTVIVYRLTPVIGFLQRIFRRCPYITLVNLMAADSIDRQLSAQQVALENELGQLPMPEYLFWSRTVPEIERWILHWLKDPTARVAQSEKLGELKSRFAVAGASRRAAELILSRIPAFSRARQKRAA